MLKQIFKHSIIYTFASQVPLFANLIILPLISPKLTQLDYGIFGTVLSYIGALTAFSDLGMIPLFQIAFFKHEEFKKTWSKYLGFLSIYKLLYAVIICLVIYFSFVGDIGEERIYLVLFLIGFPIVFFDMTRTIGLRLFQFKQQHHIVQIGTAISGVVAASTTFITIYYYDMHYMGFFVSIFCSSLTQFLYYGWMMYGRERILPTFTMKLGFVKKALKISLPIIPHNYSNYLINNSDRLVMDVLNVPMNNIGLYNIAYSFSNYFGTFNNQVNTVISPIYFNMFKRGDEKADFFIRNLTFLWLGFSLIVGFILCLWSREIFAFLYRNEDLFIAFQFAPFLLMSMCYRPMYVASVERAIWAEKTLSLMAVTFAAGVLNIVLNVVLIKGFDMGINGAIAATFVAYMYMGFAGYFIKPIKRHIKLNYYPIPVFLLVSGMSFLAWWGSQISWNYNAGGVSGDAGWVIKALISSITLIVVVWVYERRGKQMIGFVNQFDNE